MYTLPAAASTSATLARLAAERPFKTVETFQVNDFYGHASMLKRYVGLAGEKPLRSIIEHGVRFGNSNWATEINAPFFMYCCWSPSRFDVIHSATNKACFALGPLIEYVSPPRPERLEELHAAFGRNLLFFPSHSTHWVENDYDIAEICATLEQIGKDFDTVRVCMYWRDIQRGLHEEYIRRGFTVQCAGHIYDKNFYRRLREIIEPATITASMTPGSCIGHCTSLGKPYFHITTTTTWNSKHQLFYNQISGDIEQLPVTEHLAQLFKTQREDISPEQQAFLAMHLGVGHRKTPEELRRIFQLGEDIWNLSQSTAPDDNRLLALMLVAKTLEAHHAGNRLHMLRFAEQAVTLAPDLEHRVLDIIQSTTAHPGA